MNPETGFDKAQETEGAPQDAPGARNETLAGMVPFLAFGLASVSYESVPYSLWPQLQGVMISLFVDSYFIGLIGLGVGWVKGFPRWSYPFAGFILLFTSYWMGAATPGLVIFGHTFTSRELWEWRAWIPFAVMATIALLLTRSLHPWLQLVTGIWRDWTQLSFGLYGVMPLLVFLRFDEVIKPYPAPFLAVTTIVLASGALAYMRSAKTWQRALALLLSMTVAGAVATVASSIYWHWRDEYEMPWPSHGFETVRQMFAPLGFLMVVMFAPALLGLLRRAVKSAPVV